MTEDEKARVANVTQLRAIDARSKSLGFNATLDEEFFEENRPSAEFLVLFMMLHRHIAGEPVGTPHYRCFLLPRDGVRGNPVSLDMTPDDFDSLPVIVN